MEIFFKLKFIAGGEITDKYGEKIVIKNLTKIIYKWKRKSRKYKKCEKKFYTL